VTLNVTATTGLSATASALSLSTSRRRQRHTRPSTSGASGQVEFVVDRRPPVQVVVLRFRELDRERISELTLSTGR
jgi:hypothetical protein